MAPQSDFYKVLEVDSKATQQQIREAYKKAALKHHPDRVPADSPERPRRTRRFQLINDAYYTLSDPARRREYDSARRFGTASSSFPSSNEEFDEEIPRPQQSGGTGPGAAAGGFPWSTFGNMFGFGGGNKQQNTQSAPHEPNAQFESVFEEMMREEGMADGENNNRPTGKFWSIIGGVSGGAMGFIVANVPGAMAGALAGNRLGNVRDAKGKAVYSVFQELPQADKAKLLSELAQKVFAHAVSG